MPQFTIQQLIGMIFDRLKSIDEGLKFYNERLHLMSKQTEQLQALVAAQKQVSDNVAALTAAISAQETPVDLGPVIAAEQALAQQVAALTQQLTPAATPPSGN